MAQLTPQASAVPQASPAAAPPVSGPAITLEDAIARSVHADSAFAAAQATAGVARSQTAIARSALLPSVLYHNQYLYTQGQAASAATLASNGTTAPSIRFIANNTVHEYVSQASANEVIGGAGTANYLRAKADAAVASAQLEVARRGLVAATVARYYTVVGSDTKVVIARRALDEAQRFRDSTQLRETGGEVAHADVVRADLQIQQRQRELNDALLTAEKSRLDLGVLLFADPSSPYMLAASLDTLPPLPTREEIEASSRINNPDLKAALEELRSAGLDVTAARFGYFPDLALNFSYGIDAPQFAITGSDGTRNLGYSATATLDIPVWDWLATHQRVKQSQFRRDQARTDLTVAQRRLVADLRGLYDEAQVSLQQMDLLDHSVATAQETLRLMNLRYTSGEGSILEIVDAQTSVVLAESSRVDGALRYFTARANLQTLTGTLP